MAFRHRVELLVWRLRRAQRFVRKLKTIIDAHPVRSLRDVEDVAKSLGIDIIYADLGPRIYGAATRDQGKPIIVLHPELNPHHRELTLAHEFAHVQLHLPSLHEKDPVSTPTPGDVEDVEADTLAVVCLLWHLPEDEEARTVLPYVLRNPDMLRRAWKINRYFFLYRVKMWTASFLEAVFLKRPLEGAR